MEATTNYKLEKDYEKDLAIQYVKSNNVLKDLELDIEEAKKKISEMNFDERKTQTDLFYNTLMTLARNRNVVESKYQVACYTDLALLIEKQAKLINEFNEEVKADKTIYNNVTVIKRKQERKLELITELNILSDKAEDIYKVEVNKRIDQNRKDLLDTQYLLDKRDMCQIFQTFPNIPQDLAFLHLQKAIDKRDILFLKTALCSIKDSIKIRSLIAEMEEYFKADFLKDMIDCFKHSNYEIKIYKDSLTFQTQEERLNYAVNNVDKCKTIRLYNNNM